MYSSTLSRSSTTRSHPADVLIELAADALMLAGAARATPVSLTDVHDRYLPEWTISGNAVHQKSRVAIDLAVALHGGIVPGYDAAARDRAVCVRGTSPPRGASKDRDTVYLRARDSCPTERV